MTIELHHVSRRFGDHVAVDDVTLSIADGSLCALIGPSGSGKSTLLRIIAGLERPDHGTVRIGGRDVTALKPQHRGIGFVFQHYAAFRHMTVRENVAYGLRIRRRPRREIAQRVDELLELVHLEAYADRHPAQLSGGQRQRMALARSLAVQPDVLLLDEPFGALDAQVRRELRRWLRELHEQMSVTTVIVTHDQEEAMELAGDVVIMHDGSVRQQGSPREVYDHPASEWVMSFLGPVTHTAGGAVARPHDVQLLREVVEGADEAMVDRIVHLGFEVRVEVTRADGGLTWAQLTAHEADALDVSVGDIVWVRARRTSSFDGV